MQISQPCGKKVHNKPKILRSMSKKYKKIVIGFNIKILVLRMGLRIKGTEFWKPGEKNVFKKAICHSMSKTDKKNYLSRKEFFFNLFLWTRRVPFRHPCHKTFDNKSVLFCSLSESDKNIYIKSNSLQMVTWMRRMQFWQRRKKNHEA